jgi:hypothetical protein
VTEGKLLTLAMWQAAASLIRFRERSEDARVEQ